MDNLEYYIRRKELWSDTEIDQLKIEYTEKEMSIIDVGNIHQRLPHNISHKLKKLGLITHNRFARGYQEYINSNLYKEFVEKKKIHSKKKRLSEIDEIKNKICEIKNETHELRKYVKIMIKSIYKLYKFETNNFTI